MSHRKHLFRLIRLAAAAVLIGCPQPLHAKLLCSYALDSLVYMADDIVECEIGETIPENGVEIHDVTVSRIYKGDKTPVGHLRVSGLDLYSKVMGEEPASRDGGLGSPKMTMCSCSSCIGKKPRRRPPRVKRR